MNKPTTINRYLDDSSSEKFTLNKFSLRPKKRSRNAIRLFKPKQNAFIKREKRLKWRDAEKRAYIYIYIYSLEDAWSSNRKALEKYEAPVWKAASTQSPLPFFPLLPQSSRRYTIVRAIWIKARRVDAYLLGIPILQLSVSRSPCSPNARPSLPTTVGRTCVCTRAMQRPGACVPDANACAPAKARAGRKHRVDTRERARGLMDDRFCVWRDPWRGKGREGRGSVAFAWKVSRSINGFWVKNWIIHLSRSGCLAAAGRTCGWIKVERIVSVKRYKSLPQVGNLMIFIMKRRFLFSLFV